MQRCVLALLLGSALAAFDASTCDVSYTLEIREWVVDFKRPTALPRKAPFDILDANKKAAVLLNNSYPGPLIEATEGDMVCVTILNNMFAEEATIHWHGQHMRGFPSMDGVYGVTQSGIPAQGGTFTYRWIANAGTHYYHAHYQAMQSDRGIKGPMIIHAKNDPHAHMYTEDKIVALSDEWQNPEVCLRSEGGQPGNPVCGEISKATYNGVWGDGSKDYPWPMVEVEAGTCYRLRFIGMMGQAENFQVDLAGHNMTIIAVDGADTVPAMVSRFNLHAGERIDVVLCADQAPGNYLVAAEYDLATFLEKLPAPSMPKVDSARFWAFLHYKGHTERPGFATHNPLGGYSPPKGTGGGKGAVAGGGPSWDTSLRSNWGIVRNLHALPQAEKADATYVIQMGTTGPDYIAGVTPYGTTDKMYMFTNRTSWKKPQTPLLHTKGQCGADTTPFITLKQHQTVEIIINNLSPTNHVLHLHGMRFTMINAASYAETWCNNKGRFDCYFLPLAIAKKVDCPTAISSDPNTKFPLDGYWGCPYDAANKDNPLPDLDNPLQKDMVPVWRRSWSVIRFTVDNPGTWLFHCHMEHHIPTGQVMAFNMLPDQQPPIPSDVASEGPCKVWQRGA